MNTQVAFAAATAPHSSKLPIMQAHLSKMLLLGVTPLLHLATASYSMLCSIATVRQHLDACVAGSIGIRFDLNQLNDDWHAFVDEDNCSIASRTDMTAAAAAAEAALPHLRIRLSAAEAAANALLEPGTPPQQCNNSRAFGAAC